MVLKTILTKSKWLNISSPGADEVDEGRGLAVAGGTNTFLTIKHKLLGFVGKPLGKPKPTSNFPFNAKMTFSYCFAAGGFLMEIQFWRYNY